MRQSKLGAKGSRGWTGGHRPEPAPRAPSYNDLKRDLQTAIARAARHAAPVPLHELPAVVVAVFCEPDRRRDPDGVALGGIKLILDGLVQGGALPGDGNASVGGFIISFSYPDYPLHPGTGVKIEIGSWRLWLPLRLPDWNELRQAVELGVRRQLRKAVQR